MANKITLIYSILVWNNVFSLDLPLSKSLLIVVLEAREGVRAQYT